MTVFYCFIFNRHFFPSGKPNASHLLRYQGFAVEERRFILRALPLRQPRLVNNPG